MTDEQEHLANALIAFIGHPLDNPLSRSEMMETARIALSTLTRQLPNGVLCGFSYELGVSHGKNLTLNGNSRTIQKCIDSNIALAALTQPASPALRLPDAKPDHDSEDGNDIDYLEPSQVYALGVDDGFNRCLREVTKLNAPHTAHIEPSCATGGAWVKCSERMPDFDIDVMVYCADTEEQFVAYHRNDGVFHYATYTKGNAYVKILCEPTHWMPLPAAPEEK